MQVLAFDHGADMRQRVKHQTQAGIRGSSLAENHMRGAKARNIATDS